MKYKIEELQELLSSLEKMEQSDNMDTLDQWEDYKDDSLLEEIYDVCQSIIQETDNLNEYYNSL